MPASNVVAVGSLTDGIFRSESPMLKRIDELAFEAAYDSVILVSPERDGQPLPILHQPPLIETTLRVRTRGRAAFRLGAPSAKTRSPLRLASFNPHQKSARSVRCESPKMSRQICPQPMTSPHLDEPLDAFDFIREASGDVV